MPTPPLNWLNIDLLSFKTLEHYSLTSERMDEDKGIDSKESGEYEDDFEKDLEWLINDKEKSNGSMIEV